MIVVIDASTFVSAALKANSIPERALLRALDTGNSLVLSEAVAAEYQQVIFRPKFDRYASHHRRQRLLDIVFFLAERFEPMEVVSECIDPKDNKYLELAVAARAEAIVSSDLRHLLSMHPWRGIPILSPASFLDLG